jgi:hypothetical protein
MLASTIERICRSYRLNVVATQHRIGTLFLSRIKNQILPIHLLIMRQREFFDENPNSPFVKAKTKNEENMLGE